VFSGPWLRNKKKPIVDDCFTFLATFLTELLTVVLLFWPPFFYHFFDWFVDSSFPFFCWAKLNQRTLLSPPPPKFGNNSAQCIGTYHIVKWQVLCSLTSRSPWKLRSTTGQQRPALVGHFFAWRAAFSSLTSSARKSFSFHEAPFITSGDITGIPLVLHLKFLCQNTRCVWPEPLKARLSFI
jgi:hypothetical protein